MVLFECLETLVLDHNLIHAETAIPRSGPKNLKVEKNSKNRFLLLFEIKCFQVLWLNHNGIARLDPLARLLGGAFPSLAYLSMMGNPAAAARTQDAEGFHGYAAYRYASIILCSETRTNFVQ